MRSARAAIFFACFGFFLVTNSREVLWADSKSAYLVAEHLVRNQRIDIGYAWPEGVPRGRNGKFYSVYPALTSAVHLPGAALQELVRRAWPKAGGFAHPITGHLSCAALAALACVLFFGLCRKLGVSAGVASAATVALATATLLWPYAHDPFSEALQAACFTGFFAALLDTAERRARGFALGAWAGLLVNAKLILVLALPGAAVYLAARLWGDWRRLGRVVASAALAFAPFLALVLAYSYARTGSFVETAVTANENLFKENAIFGLWGFFASLGKSVFRYSPPLLVSLAALPLFWRRHRAVAIALLVTAGPILLAYGKYSMWPGDHAWGPRYLVFLHPLLLLPATLLVQDLVRQGLRRWHKIALGLVFACGVAAQCLGIVFWRGHWIRISYEVDRAWLGKPTTNNLDGFEWYYLRAWLPPFDPLEGHLWMLRHVVTGDSAEIAEADAPWRRYTKGRYLPAPVYDGIKVDWWPLLFIKDHPAYRWAGGLLLGAEVLLLGAGAWLWLRALREPTL